MYAAYQLKEACAILAPEAESIDQLVGREVLFQLEKERLHIFIQTDLERVSEQGWEDTSISPSGFLTAME